MDTRDYSPIQLHLPLTGFNIEFPVKGRIAIINAVDYDLLRHRWDIAAGYIDRSTRKGHIKMHRVVLERILGRSLGHGEYTDHINGNKLDNRRENLRVATVQQNGANARTPAHNSSGMKGVRFHHGKWCAQIKVNQKNIHLGSFDTPEQARQAYFEAAERYFGEFARRE